MAFDAHKNFAFSTVASAPSPATSGTSLVVATGDGTKFPAAPFNATIWPANTQPTAANAEIVRVTNVSTDTLTITRTQESTSARTVVVGDQIAATVTAKTLTDVEANVWAIANGGTGQATAQAGINALAGTATAGKALVGDGTNWSPDYPMFEGPESLQLPSGTLAVTIPGVRWSGLQTGAFTMASGTLHVVPIWLTKGLLVTSITFVSVGAGSALTHQVFGLYDNTKARLRVTNDDTSTAWGASTAKTLNLTSTFTTTYQGLHWLGILVTGTPPTLAAGFALSAGISGRGNAINGNTNDTGLTSLPNPFGTITQASTFAYADVS
jgi:hypothetical protein